MRPRRPPLQARAAVNWTRPKSVSRCSPQKAIDVHTDGGSTIQSAEEVAVAAALSVRTNPVARLRSRTDTVTRLPATPTDAATTSPGRRPRGTRTQGPGASSYQANARGEPAAEQSASVPACSSTPEPPGSPPRPTQNEADVGP